MSRPLHLRHSLSALALGVLGIGCGLSFDLSEVALPIVDASPEAEPSPGEDASPGDDARDATGDTSKPAPIDECANGLRDGDETDVDCGGRCSKGCATGRGCGMTRDCAEGLVCEAGACRFPTSCKELQDERPTSVSAVYTIKPKAAPYPAGCDMQLFGGGFTLVMRIDGSKNTFDFDSNLWTTARLLNETDASLSKTSEAKLAPFHDVPFAEVALQLDTKATTRALKIAAPKASLAELVASAESTNLGRTAWLDLVPGSSLQPACSAEGFSVVRGGARVRIGMLGNDSGNATDCGSPDSFVGVGSSSFCGRAPRAGNVACFNGAGGDRTEVSFARVLVR
jgi:hypothetical protein